MKQFTDEEIRRLVPELPVERTRYAQYRSDSESRIVALLFETRAELERVKEEWAPVKIIQDNDEWGGSGCWKCSGCKDARYFEDGTPEEHGVKFCTACGHPVEEFVPYEPKDPTDE